MLLDWDELCELHPTLYHVTFSANRERILAEGLKSAATLKSMNGEHDISAGSPRKAPTTLKCGAVLNDQKPMLDGVLDRCAFAESFNASSWVTYLDGHIFFWATEDRLASFLEVRRKLDYQSVVFQVPTRELVGKFGDEVLLSEQNTGGPYGGNPTRRIAFKPIETFPFRDLVKKRGNRRKAIVEVVLRSEMTDPKLLIEIPREAWPTIKQKKGKN